MTNNEIIEREQIPRIPVDSVRIVVRSQQDPTRFVIVAEADDPENWKLPGGKFEDDESVIDAMIREAKEELNLDGVEGDFIELPNHDGISKRFIFLATIDPTLISQEPDDSDDPERIIGRKWVTREEIEASQLKNREHILDALDVSRPGLRD